nr:hypothetical protein [Tanacetum cinerariifolium]
MVVVDFELVVVDKRSRWWMRKARWQVIHVCNKGIVLSLEVDFKGACGSERDLSLGCGDKKDMKEGSTSSIVVGEEGGEGESSLFPFPFSHLFGISKEFMTRSCKVKFGVIELGLVLRMYLKM